MFPWQKILQNLIIAIDLCSYPFSRRFHHEKIFTRVHRQNHHNHWTQCFLQPVALSGKLWNFVIMQCTADSELIQFSHDLLFWKTACVRCIRSWTAPKSVKIKFGSAYIFWSILLNAFLRSFAAFIVQTFSECCKVSISICEQKKSTKTVFGQPVSFLSACSREKKF